MNKVYKPAFQKLSFFGVLIISILIVVTMILNLQDGASLIPGLPLPLQLVLLIVIVVALVYYTYQDRYTSVELTATDVISRRGRAPSDQIKYKDIKEVELIPNALSGGTSILIVARDPRFNFSTGKFGYFKAKRVRSNILDAIKQG